MYRQNTQILINSGKASSLDLELLGEEIRDNVKKFNIKLNWELIRVGSFKKFNKILILRVEFLTN